jgi:hypothetical protein
VKPFDYYEEAIVDHSGDLSAKGQIVRVVLHTSAMANIPGPNIEPDEPEFRTIHDDSSRTLPCQQQSIIPNNTSLSKR